MIRRLVHFVPFLACLAAAGAVAAPQFVEVAVSCNLQHTVQYGTTFDGLDLGNAMMQRNIGNGAAVGDYDRDGDLDVYLLSQQGFTNRLFRNDLDLGVKQFTDVSAAAGVDCDGFSRVAGFVDLDNDGWLDLLVLNDDDGSGLYTRSVVFRNRGDGTFEDVTAGSGFPQVGMLRGGMAFGDYDDDGLMDVYVTNWGRETGGGVPLLPGANVLLRNLGGFRFQDVNFDTHINYLQRDSFTAIFHDFDENSLDDIFVAIDHTSDEFYRNLGGGILSQDTVDVNAVHTGNDMGVACADIDDDGDLDLYATNITDPDYLFGSTQYNALHINQYDSTGSLYFVDEAEARNVEDTYWGWGTEFTDVENDGDLDIVAVTGFDEFVQLAGIPGTPLLNSPSVLFINNGSASFTRNNNAGIGGTDDSRGLVAFDYDRDGDEDLLVTNIQEPVRLFENVSTQQGNWLQVELVQSPGANRDGIGAAVFYTIGSTTRRRDVIVNDSYLSASPAEVHLGLGSASVVDEIRVRWTDGTESTFADVSANQSLRLSQASPDADLDGVADGDDCAAGDATSWSAPAAVSDLSVVRIAGGARLAWSLPPTAGGMDLVFDVLRGEDPSAGDAGCWQTDMTDRETTDAESPATIFYYLVRSRNGCGDALGPASVPRVSPTCP